MKKLISAKFLIGTLIACASLSAHAEFTVTIQSRASDAIELSRGEHCGIEHPSYFDKTVNAGETIQVHAKWMNELNCRKKAYDGRFIVICSDLEVPNQSNDCIVISHNDDSKHVYLTDDGIYSKNDMSDFCRLNECDRM